MEIEQLSRSDIEQLLQEAGCPGDFTQQFLITMDTKSLPEQLNLLRTQRTKQLERIHKEEKQLDQLDFLRYMLERSAKSK